MRFTNTLQFSVFQSPMLLGLWMLCFDLAGAGKRRPGISQHEWYPAYPARSIRRRNTSNEWAGISRWLIALRTGNIREGPD